MILTILIVLCVVSLMIFFNALYVAGEFSAVSARKTRIIQMADQGNKMARMILPVLQDRHKLDNYIAASQVGITLSSIVLGIYGQQQIAPQITPLLAKIPFLSADSASSTEVAAGGIAAVLVLIVLTTLQVVMGELIPKSVAMQYPERMALLTALPMKWSAEYILRPLIVLLNGSGVLALKLLGAEPGGHAHVHSPEEILLLVKESRRGGLLDADEERFLQNVLRGGQTHAVEVATPRTRIVAAPVDSPAGDVLRLAADSAYSRIPIFEGDIDHIIGFVHLRELFSLYRTNPEGNLSKILRKIPYVPGSLATAEVWSRLDETKSYLAIVLDEYGGTSGLITREDLVEELFGELQDEFDSEDSPITAMAEGRFLVRGDMPISTLNDLLEINLPHLYTHTIGGLVMKALGRIPEVGTIVEVGGIHLRIEQVTGRSVRKVCVMLPLDQPPTADEAGP